MFFSKKNPKTVRAQPHRARLFVPGWQAEAIHHLNPEIRKILHMANLPKKILTNTVGKNHPMWSRLLVGLILIVVGEFFAEGQLVSRIFFHLVRDAGGIPWIEGILLIASEPV